MRQKLYIFGIVTTMVVIAGTILKINHWPGAGILLLLGLGTLVLLFLPLALINHYNAEKNRQTLLLHIVTWLTCFIVFTSMLFKIQHWPFAGILMTIALPFPYVVFLPVFLITTSKDKNFNIFNTVFVLFLLAVSSVFSALLGLNVSRERIYDSYNLSRHYNIAEKELKLAGNEVSSPLTGNIDDVLNLLDDYRDLILREENMNIGDWETNPEDLQKPESQRAILSATGNKKLMDDIERSFRDLIQEARNSQQYKDLADALPAILDLQVDESLPVIKYQNLTNSLSWTLINLDGIETNLKLIRATL
jgi:hypothetical protein